MKLPVFVSGLPGFLEVPVAGWLAEPGALWVPLGAASLLWGWEWHLQWHGGGGSAFLSLSHDEVGTDFSGGQSHVSLKATPDWTREAEMHNSEDESLGASHKQNKKCSAQKGEQLPPPIQSTQPQPSRNSPKVPTATFPHGT